MRYKYKYETIEERDELIKSNSDKYIIGYENLIEGDFIIFTDEEPLPNEMDVIKKKIDILEAEKEKLLEITKEQDKLLVDNTYKISMLEMNLGGM